MSNNNLRRRENNTAVVELIEPAVAVILEYLSGDMPAEDMAAVELRMATDEVFLEKAIPFMELAHTPIDFNAVQLQVERNMAGNAVETTECPAPESIRGSSRRAKSHSFNLWTVAKWSAGSIMAAGLLIALLVPLSPAIQRAAANDARSAAGLVASGAETRDVTVSQGTQMSLAPYGLVSYSHESFPESAFTRTFHGGAGQRLTIILRGSVIITSAKDADIVEVVTAGGRVMLAPNGKYEVTSSDSTGHATVLVRQGRATLLPADKTQRPTTLMNGEWGSLNGRLGQEGHP